MSKSIKITGVKELEAKLKKNMTLDHVKDTVKQNGSDLQTLMTRNANFVKGYSIGTTRRSIRSTYTDSGLTVEVKPTTYYSPYLEYGTRFMSAQPFVRPSFNIQKEIFKRELKKLMKWGVLWILNKNYSATF